VQIFIGGSWREGLEMCKNQNFIKDIFANEKYTKISISQFKVKELCTIP